MADEAPKKQKPLGTARNGQNIITLLVSEAGLGLRAGETRTVSEETAERMFKLGSCEGADWPAEAPAKPAK
jgi:hypothetical protein